jgi:hypothetical protein
VTEIAIDITNRWSLGSMQSLSMFIDFSRIIQLVWDPDYYEQRSQPTLVQLNHFFEQARNLSSLVIWRYFTESSQTIDNLCSIIPHRMKHLQMPVDSLKQIKTILERCQNLSAMQFICPNEKLSIEVIEWFAHNTINSTCHTNHGRIFVWLGKKTIQSTEIKSHHRRLKLFSCCSKS